MRLPRYSEYKRTTLSTFKQVPSHWSVQSLKRCFKVVGGSTPKSDVAAFWDGDIVWVSPADLSKLTGSQIRDSARKITKAGLESCGTTLVPEGSLILSTRAPIGSLAISASELCTNQGCKSLVPLRNVHAPFFAYYLKVSTEALNVRGKGTTFLELSTDELSEFSAPCPPLGEQVAVAEFLDRETAKIDALIAEQEKLIALLAEKRQATISHAVTCGLNRGASMKDSGVPWLGTVPTHWDRVQLGKLCSAVSDGPHFSPAYVDEGVMFLSARNVRVDGWSLEDAKYISEEDYAEFSRRVIPEIGDVLYTKGGTTGVARVVDLVNRFQVWVHIAVLKLKRELALPHYVAYGLNSVGCYEQSQLYTRGATNNDLGLTRMSKIFLALPPIQEQAEIVEYLDCEVGKFDSLRSEGQRAILLLRERRSALITAAVTGQIDVRSAVGARVEESEAIPA